MAVLSVSKAAGLLVYIENKKGEVKGSFWKLLYSARAAAFSNAVDLLRLCTYL